MIEKNQFLSSVRVCFKLTSVVVLIEGPGQDVVGPDALLDGLHVLRARPVLVHEHVDRAVLAPLKAVPPRALSNR